MRKIIIYFICTILFCAVAACGKASSPTEIIIMPAPVNQPPIIIKNPTPIVEPEPIIEPEPIVEPKPEPEPEPEPIVEPKPVTFLVTCYCWKGGQRNYGPVRATAFYQAGQWGVITAWPSGDNIQVNGDCGRY